MGVAVCMTDVVPNDAVAFDRPAFYLQISILYGKTMLTVSASFKGIKILSVMTRTMYFLLYLMESII